MDKRQPAAMAAVRPSGACSCEKPEDTFPERTNLYSEYFLPDGWELHYETLKQPDRTRVLYLTGRCLRCQGKMRSGISLQHELTEAALLEHIYTQMRQYRPFSAGSQVTGKYDGNNSQRARWYQQQDDLSLVPFNEQFIDIFRTEDQPAVRGWVESHHGQQEYTRPQRDRKSKLFRTMLERARASGSIAHIEPILDYYLPNHEEPASHYRDTYLTDYQFDISPQVTFGSSEGLYMVVYLQGRFDDSGVEQTRIGVFKTLRNDLEACRLMGELGGILMYFGTNYVDEEIHRYTPQDELAAEYRRKVERARAKKEQKT